MKGYYLYYQDIADQGSRAGIDLKVADQIEAFNRAGLCCEFKYCPQPSDVFGMAKSCLPGFSDGVVWPDIEQMSDADYLYIRRPRFISKELVAFLREVKSNSSNIKVILELPTYPYDAELMAPNKIPALVKDRINRKKLNSFVDKIADLSGQSEIFGISTIPFFNGINLERVKKRRASGVEPSHIRVMCAASYANWHGIDRFLLGIAEYYEQGGKRRITLYLAGDGTALESLKRIAKEKKIEDHVLFLGNLNQEELDTLYNQCSFAVASLGLHRIGISTASTLKTREYLAKGMPFIYSGDVDVFSKAPFGYCFRIPADESKVDLGAFVAFHDAVYTKHTESEVIDVMREYAERTVGIDTAMSDVIDYVQKS